MITVTNPNDWQSITVAVADALGGCTVSGGGVVTVGPSASAAVPYACTFANAPSTAIGTNTALATWDQNAFYTLPGGSAAASAPYAFAPLTVTDTFNGTPAVFGPIVGNVAATTFTYSHTVGNGLGGTCTAYTNTAVINETGASASQTVTICNMATGDATMGFWANRNGQSIINRANQSAPAAYLQQYPPFADLTSPIAAYVSGVVKAASASGTTMNAMLKAQMLGTSLGVYFSDPGLGGNKIDTPTPLGGVKIDLTTICATVYNPTSSTAACFNNVTEGTAAAFNNATTMTVAQLLAFAGSRSNPGGSMWYGNVKSIQELAKDVFDAIKQPACEHRSVEVVQSAGSRAAARLPARPGPARATIAKVAGPADDSHLRGASPPQEEFIASESPALTRHDRKVRADSRRRRRDPEHGYNGHEGMRFMRSANIAELRDRLTQYLREVRAGEEIVVRDRQRPIAKIVPLTVDDDADDAALVAAGLMRKAQQPLPAAFWRARRASVTVRAAAAAVGKDRADR